MISYEVDVTEQILRNPLIRIWTRPWVTLKGPVLS